MPIQVTCPGCHARFKVSDKFAGKTGPCPKCKSVMQIPALEKEVVIHTPEGFGPKDKEGRAVLKPIEREETRVSTVMIVAGVVACLVVPLAAYFVGWAFRTGDEVRVPTVFLGLGAFLLAPPLVWTGYAFLRNDELEPYRGNALAARVAVCAVVYALLWGLYALLCHFMLAGATPELWQLTFMLPMLVVPGALASLATLDLDATNAAIHYGTYLLVTVLLRLTMGMSPF